MSRFLLGAATAAHQIEGNNIHSDAWASENMTHSTNLDRSGICLDGYNRYEEDIKLLAGAGLNTYRFSIEWARIEPKEGAFSETEIAHYRNVLECCHRYGIEPIVTLHHFTSPVWLIRKGGWESEQTIEYFARYCAYVTQKLGGYMRYVCTINEANMGIGIASVVKKLTGGTLQVGLNVEEMLKGTAERRRENIEAFGTESPAVFLGPRTKKGDKIIIDAHLAAKKAIKAIYPDLQVGLTLSLHDVQAVSGGEQNAQVEWEEEFLHYVPFLKDDDFIGVQNYSRKVFDAAGELEPQQDKLLLQTGYEYYPAALENVVQKVYEALKIPILVTENGVATDDDDLRCRFIDAALEGMRRCIKAGIPVKGYLHWSLLDNFEWQRGFAVTFGLISVNRATQERIPKKSLYHLGKYAR